MKGVKEFIKDHIPQSWEHVLRKRRCYQNFINQFYEAIAPIKNRNKYYCSVSIQRARHDLRCCSINAIAAGYKFKEGVEYWNDIAKEISNYEFNCN